MSGHKPPPPIAYWEPADGHVQPLFGEVTIPVLKLSVNPHTTRGQYLYLEHWAYEGLNHLERRGHDSSAKSFLSIHILLLEVSIYTWSIGLMKA